MVQFTCMTTKKKFEVEDPEILVLRNGRFAYRAECPWQGKNGKTLTAFKFASKKAYEDQFADKEEVEQIVEQEVEQEVEME